MIVGLYFGSFNPIHIGHLIIANYIVEYGGIDELWFVVSPHNPFKQKNNLLDDYQRLQLVNLAIDDDYRFKACDIEFRLPKPSYTINTLAYLSDKFPTKTFKPIIGGDNFETLSKWKNHEILFRDYEFIVYPRPGYNIDTTLFEGKFQIIDAPQIEISSTFIREAISKGKDVRHFLNPKVYKYITEMNFYK